MGEQLVNTEIIEDHIALVTIDNPPVNAHSAQVLDELASTFDAISDRAELRVAVLTGAGKVFCAGADIKNRADRPPQPGDHWQTSRAAREAYHSIRECQKPVIGAINGPALGGGLAIADLAREVAAKSPIAIRMAKHSLNTIEELSLRDGYRFEQTMTGELGKTEDSREAMRAFAEKRTPVFKGS